VQLQVCPSAILDVWLEYPLLDLLLYSRFDFWRWSAICIDCCQGSVYANVERQINSEDTLRLLIHEERIKLTGNAKRPLRRLAAERAG
jgi:hypothetical protein